MTSDLLQGAKSKVARANEHILEVTERIQGFFQTPPYPIATFQEVDPTSSRESLKVRLTRPIPHEIAVVTGDALNNLRSALDHLACSLALKNGASNLSGVYFPFAGDRREFDLPATQRKMRRLSPEARDLIATLMPYRGGNDFLWSLNKLAGMDKHQSLVAVATLAQGWQGAFTMRAVSTEPHVFEAARYVRLDQDGTLLRYPAGGDLQGDCEITLDVAFAEVDPVKDQSVTAVLSQFSALVEHILLLFEGRFFK